MRFEPQIALHAARPLMAAAMARRQAKENEVLAIEDSACPQNTMFDDDRLKQWDPEGEIMKTALLATSPAREWEAMTVEFYLIFWSLSLYDIKVPTKAYEGQIALLRSKYNSAQRELDDLEKRKKEMTRCLNTVEALSQELAVQKDHCRRVVHKLQARRDTLLGPVVMTRGPRVKSCYCYFNSVRLYFLKCSLDFPFKGLIISVSRIAG